MDGPAAGDPAKANEAVLMAMARAWHAEDEAALRVCLAEDIVWCQEIGPDAPDGRVLKGRDAFIEGYWRRRRQVRNVRIVDNEYRVLPDFAVQTFRLTGEDAQGRPVDLRVCDLYRFKDGLVALKDTFWKTIV